MRRLKVIEQHVGYLWDRVHDSFVPLAEPFCSLLGLTGRHSGAVVALECGERSNGLRSPAGRAAGVKNEFNEGEGESHHSQPAEPRSPAGTYAQDSDGLL